VAASVKCLTISDRSSISALFINSSVVTWSRLEIPNMLHLLSLLLWWCRSTRHKLLWDFSSVCFVLRDSTSFLYRHAQSLTVFLYHVYPFFLWTATTFFVHVFFLFSDICFCPFSQHGRIKGRFSEQRKYSLMDNRSRNVVFPTYLGDLTLGIGQMFKGANLFGKYGPTDTQHPDRQTDLKQCIVLRWKTRGKRRTTKPRGTPLTATDRI